MKTYYSVLRPVSIGTYPKEGLVDFENFDCRTYVPEIDRMAWAKLEYNRELTAKEKDVYDLVEGA